MQSMPVLARFLAVWLVANFAPHVVVFFATGKIYYQLNPLAGIAAETSIMLLNLLLPVVVLRRAEEEHDMLARLGWRWPGARAIWIGIGATAAMFALSIASQRLIADPVALPRRAIAQSEMALAMVMMLALNTAAEETMFRGYLQTGLSQIYGAALGIGISALLFGLRHLPMDIYAAVATDASAAAWVSRMVQMYGVAALLGLARHWGRSTWASWIAHEGMMILVIALSVLPRLVA
jgi:membrane protease YdiL (CAAX protease family)